MIKIALLDDGVNSKDIYLNNDFTKYKITSNLKLRKCKSEKKITHGTICASIIAKSIKNVDFISIKIKSFNEDGKLEYLLSAINYCIKMNVKIISLSVGSTSNQDFEKISKVIKKALDLNIIIIAAYSNDGEKTYPASFDNVIGVRHFPCNRKFKIGKHSENKIDIMTDGRAIIRKKNGEIIFTPPCNSYSAAVVTNYIAQLIFNNNITYKNLVLLLQL